VDSCFPEIWFKLGKLGGPMFLENGMAKSSVMSASWPSTHNVPGHGTLLVWRAVEL